MLAAAFKQAMGPAPPAKTHMLIVMTWKYHLWYVLTANTKVQVTCNGSNVAPLLVVCCSRVALTQEP